VGAALAQGHAAVAVGNGSGDAIPSDESTMIGSNAHAAAAGGTAVGFDAATFDTHALALGYNAQANPGAPRAVALGPDTRAFRPGEVQFFCTVAGNGPRGWWLPLTGSTDGSVINQSTNLQDESGNALHNLFALPGAMIEILVVARDVNAGRARGYKLTYVVLTGGPPMVAAQVDGANAGTLVEIGVGPFAATLSLVPVGVSTFQVHFAITDGVQHQTAIAGLLRVLDAS
jgi:hypothetical protein